MRPSARILQEMVTRWLPRSVETPKILAKEHVVGRFGTEGSEVRILSPRPLKSRRNRMKGPGNRAFCLYARSCWEVATRRNARVRVAVGTRQVFALGGRRGARQGTAGRTGGASGECVRAQTEAWDDAACVRCAMRRVATAGTEMGERQGDASTQSPRQVGQTLGCCSDGSRASRDLES